VLQVQLKSSPSRNASSIYPSLTDKVKKMTFPNDITDSIRRRAARRNSLGNERTVTFCKPSPERNSIRSIKEYTTTQSVKELSIDSSQVDDEVTSKAITSKTPGILRTPNSAPTKTFSARNRLDPPKTSYSRTNHSEVFDTVLVLCSLCFVNTDKHVHDSLLQDAHVHTALMLLLIRLLIF
jgi:NIMA (never in mitosis gene a)-related kinase 1/4/5